jgi:hypothetical protein
MDYFVDVLSGRKTWRTTGGTWTGFETRPYVGTFTVN